MQLIGEFVFQYGELFLKVALCVVLVGLIGYNREKSGMTVGIRTHILVGLSAVLLQATVLEHNAENGSTGDIFRLSSAMLSGVGFLGTGAIIKGGKSVKGLTTAASLFFVVCIGISVGTGMYMPAILVSTVGYLFLTDIFRIKRLIRINKSLIVTLELELMGNYSDSTNDITEALSDIDVDIESIDIAAMSIEKSKIKLKLKANDEVDTNSIIDSLMNVKSIAKVEYIKTK